MWNTCTVSHYIACHCGCGVVCNQCTRRHHCYHPGIIRFTLMGVYHKISVVIKIPACAPAFAPRINTIKIVYGCLGIGSHLCHMRKFSAPPALNKCREMICVSHSKPFPIPSFSKLHKNAMLLRINPDREGWPVQKHRKPVNEFELLFWSLIVS